MTARPDPCWPVPLALGSGLGPAGDAATEVAAGVTFEWPIEIEPGTLSAGCTADSMLAAVSSCPSASVMTTVG
ncbi:hypothetical protein ACX80E_12345 [Arthrobacter sp. TMN-49]